MAYQLIAYFNWIAAAFGYRILPRQRRTGLGWTLIATAGIIQIGALALHWYEWNRLQGQPDVMYAWIVPALLAFLGLCAIVVAFVPAALRRDHQSPNQPLQLTSHARGSRSSSSRPSLPAGGSQLSGETLGRNQPSRIMSDSKTTLTDGQIKIRRRRNVGMAIAAIATLIVASQAIKAGEIKPSGLIAVALIAIVYAAIEHSTLASSVRRSRQSDSAT